MTAQPLEVLLARLLSSPAEVEIFLSGRRAYAIGAGVGVEDMPQIEAIDAEALRFAAASYERKRQGAHIDATRIAR
jgi:hypothetical protein